MSVHDGHRKRLDKKVIEKGFEMLEPHEQLEHLLFAVVPRGNTNDIAHRLLQRYVTVAGVINADVEELMKVEGVGPRTAMFLSTLPQLLGVVERSVTVEAPIDLEDFDVLSKYVRTFFYGKLIEEVYVFSLNSSYRLLAVSKIAEGSPSEAGLTPQAVLKQAIRDNASIVVVAHNHPCGVLKPSQADIELTTELFRRFRALGIILHDSVIVSGGECYSIMKEFDIEKMCKGK